MVRKANIGIVCYPTPGGSGVVATELGKTLAGLGHRVHFITYGLPARLNYFDENLYFQFTDEELSSLRRQAQGNRYTGILASPRPDGREG